MLVVVVVVAEAQLAFVIFLIVFFVQQLQPRLNLSPVVVVVVLLDRLMPVPNFRRFHLLGLRFVT